MKDLKFWGKGLYLCFLLIVLIIGLAITKTTYDKGYAFATTAQSKITNLKISYAVEKTMHEVDKVQQAAEIIEIKALLKEFGEKGKLTSEKHSRLAKLFHLEKYDKPIIKIPENEIE